MFLKLKGGLLRELILQGINNTGTIRKLAIQTKISKSALSDYHLEKRFISEKNLSLLLKYLNIKLKDEDILERFPDNWRQILGGKNCVKSKIKKGTYKADLEKAQQKGALKFKEWHRQMKENSPREYYLLQYSHFKKIGGYKFITDKGEKVRNNFEKQVADTLNKLNIPYQYESLIHIGKKYFFPDFLIKDKIIIEATAWRGKVKAYKLMEKIKELKKRYLVYVVVPKNLYSYYKILNDNLILGLDELSSRSSVW